MSGRAHDWLTSHVEGRVLTSRASSSQTRITESIVTALAIQRERGGVLVHDYDRCVGSGGGGGDDDGESVISRS